MPQIVLSEPNWDNLVGGDGEAAWIADLDRKVAIADEVTQDILNTVRELERQDALVRCSPEALRSVSFAADWYISLAGYSLKTLGQVPR